MKKSSMRKTPFALLLACEALLVLVFVCAGCEEIPSNSKYVPASGASVSKTIQTIKYDGHSFVVISDHNGCSIVHHPSCACQKYAEHPPATNDR